MKVRRHRKEERRNETLFRRGGEEKVGTKKGEFNTQSSLGQQSKVVKVKSLNSGKEKRSGIKTCHHPRLDPIIDIPILSDSSASSDKSSFQTSSIHSSIPRPNDHL